MADILPFPVKTRCYKVLVVDDEPAIRGVVCEFLKDGGIHAVGAENADRALQLIRQGLEIDLVFSDVRMPGEQDGCGLARWLLENRPDIPVLLASGDVSKTKAAAGLSGVETFAKPYDFGAAVKKIRETIERRVRRAV